VLILIAVLLATLTYTNSCYLLTLEQAKGWNDDFCHGSPFYFALDDICDKSHWLLWGISVSRATRKARLGVRGPCYGRAEVRLNTSVYFGIDCRQCVIASLWSKWSRAPGSTS